MKTKALLCFALLSAATYTQGQDLNSTVELLRSDLKTQKTAIITKAMQFSDQEATAFWPIYRAYEQDLAKIGDARVALIKDFAANYGTMSGEKARELAKHSLKLQEQKVGLLKKYHKEIDKKVSPIHAARFVQLENQIGMLIDLQVGSELPLAK